jgi:hypothetical protein
MEREVLHDCHSEQVKALIEEHNKTVEFLAVLAGGAAGLEQMLPSMIVVTTKNRRIPQ